MTDHDLPVTEDELHAYVDGELPADRRAAVERWLADHPDDMARVAAWRAQAEAIRARYGAVASEPVPARFDLDRLARPSRSWRAIAAAAAVAAFLVGGIAGWMARGASAAAPNPVDIFTAEALRRPQALRRSRCAIRSRCPATSSRIWCSGCRGGSAIRLRDSRSAGVRTEAGRRPPAAGADRRRRVLHV